MYLNHHLKRIHCQGTSQNTIVIIDIEQYDSGDLIGEVYYNLDEDSNCSGVTDRVGW
jgi:hypothetical protein